MNGRLAAQDRAYRRRMAASASASMLVLLVSLVVLPSSGLLPLPVRIAQEGLLRVLPELDIIPDEVANSHLTAAPRQESAADFTSVEVVDPVEKQTPSTEVQTQVLKPVQALPAGEDPFRVLTLDDLGREVRTTGHPVLAQADIQILHLERPVYPPEAVEKEIQGIVEVMLYVDENGGVEQTYVVGERKYAPLERSAVVALRQTIFRPYMVGGRPTPFWVRIPVEFYLVD